LGKKFKSIKIMQVCVYCASSGQIHADYFHATEVLAKSLVQSQIQVVFGGGASGLMGKLADVVLSEGGKIKGIMPQFMNEVEWGHKGVDDFTYTHTMHERKAKFLEGTDAIIALPGGTGTLEELFEAITLRKLGQIDTPIIILNTRGYYDPFVEMMKRAEDERFMLPDLHQVWQVVSHPEEIVPAIMNTEKVRLDITKQGTLR
jgi:uncharacterized protein (TIGR00730 family)